VAEGLRDEGMAVDVCLHGGEALAKLDLGVCLVLASPS
jgi:hypothetical protein